MEDICRLCLSISSERICTLGDENILMAIETCLAVTIKSHELLPRDVCKLCADKIEEMYSFRKTVVRNERILQEHLDKGKEALRELYCNLNVNCRVEENISEDNEIKQLILKNTNELTLKIEKVDDDEISHEINYSSEDDIASCVKEKENNSKCEIVLNKDFNDSETKFKIEGKFKCLTCFVQCETQIDLIKHYNEVHNRNSQNKNDNKKLKSYVIVRNEDKILYKCEVCDKEYKLKKRINRHLTTHTEDRPFLCKMCGRTYKTASDIVRHGKVHSEFQLICSYQCGYVTAHLGALKEHELRHKRVFKYTCELCNKGFYVKTWYDQHQNIHKGLKPFICDICGMAFHMDRYLTAHRSRLHPQSSNLKRYVCVHCSLPCDSRNTLSNHLKVHGIKSSALCDICGKVLSNAEQLKVHTRTHLGIKLYKCSLCNKSFLKKFNLNVHEQSHTGKKSHGCAKCGKRYTQRSALNRHNIRHHGGSLKCAKCQKIFQSQSKLDAHQGLCF